MLACTLDALLKDSLPLSLHSNIRINLAYVSECAERVGWLVDVLGYAVGNYRTKASNKWIVCSGRLSQSSNFSFSHYGDMIYPLILYFINRNCVGLLATVAIAPGQKSPNGGKQPIYEILLIENQLVRFIETHFIPFNICDFF